jgi:hypothetical protein
VNQREPIIKRCLEISTEKLKSALEGSRKTQRPLPQLGVITPRPSWCANLTQGKSHFKERWDIRTLCANQPCQANQQRDTDRVRFEQAFLGMNDPTTKHIFVTCWVCLRLLCE